MSKASYLRSGKTKVGDRIDNTETPEQTECYSCKCDIGHGSGTKVVECDLCKKWFCIKCLGMSSILFAELRKAKDSLLITCKVCKGNVRGMEDLHTAITHNHQNSEKRFNSLDETIANIKADLKETVKSEVAEQLKGVDDKIENELQALNVRLQQLEISSKTVELEASAGGIDKETLINTVREEISERNDIIRRKHNLVVFNINELSSEFQNDRAVYDKTAVLDFFNAVLHKDQAIVESDFTSIFRIGITVEGASNKGPRPIIVVMKSVNVKYSVLKAYSAKRAKKVEFDNKMSVIPDRTPAQRKSYRERTKSTQAERTNVGNSSDADSATNPTGDSASRSSTENNCPLAVTTDANGDSSNSPAKNNLDDKRPKPAM